MRKTRLSYVGVVAAAAAALTFLTVAPAQGAPKPDKEPVDTASAPVDSNLAPDRTASSRSAVSTAAASTLAVIQQRIATYVALNGMKYTFGSYVDPSTGKVVVDTDAPVDVVVTLTNVGARAGIAPVQVEVRRLSTSDTWHRRDDISPYYAGGGIAASGSLCSAGYAVRNSAGTRFMVTAGHCYANGTTVRSESGANVYGIVFSRRLPTASGHPMDVEILGGLSYSGRVFTGGVTSTTSIPVVSAGPATVGYNAYCHSGRTTGEQCGHTVISTSAQVCTQTGCKQPVIAYRGGVIQQGGDSGGTFYAKNASGAWIRGHVIASSSTVGYVQPWTVVTAALGVSIVTG